MLHLVTTSNTGQFKLSAPYYVSAEVATHRGHAIWITQLFQQHPQPEAMETPPHSVLWKKVLANHTEVHEHEQPFLLYRALTSADVRPGKPPASPTLNLDYSYAEPSYSPTQFTIACLSFGPYESFFLTPNF